MADYVYSPDNFEQDKELLKYVDTLQVKEHYVKITLYNPYVNVEDLPSYKGEFDWSNNYNKDDIVSYNGDFYRFDENFDPTASGSPPDPQYFPWTKMTETETQKVGDIEGVVTQGSISVNGNSAVRRAGSLTLVVPDEKIFGAQYKGQTIHKVTDLKNLIAINKRARIYIGYTNTGNQYLEYDMFWFPLGTFTLQNPSVTHSNSGVQVQVKLSDLMTLLNGTNGGDLQMAIIHSPVTTVIDGEYKDEAAILVDLVKTLVTDMGRIANPVIDIPEFINNQIYRWVGDGNLYAFEDADDLNRFYLSTNKDANDTYFIFEPQDPVGIQTEEFTYPDKLSSNPGESIMSVLDKIKKTLGNYEYFFDIDGIFHFQEIDNGLNDGVAPDNLTEAITTKYFADRTGDKKQEIDYEFTDGQLISSFLNTPKFEMVKNNLVAWGKNNDTKLGIRYHLLIDKMPIINKDEDKYVCQFYMDDFGVQRIFTARKDATADAEDEDVIVPEDWRQLRYLQAIEKKTNLTAFEKELVEEWPKIYDVVGTAGFFYDANPVALDYWVDMINVDELTGLNDNTLVTDMSISEIGDRPKTYNDEKVNCIFAPTTHDIRLFKDGAAKEEYDANSSNTTYTKYCIVDNDEIWSNLAKGIAHNSAFDYMRSLLHEHISVNNSISLQSMPIYYLEPNMRIKVKDDESDIDGEYIISSLTMPLTVNGMMTIQATQAIERI